MNGAARTKGWGIVETKMLSWLAEFKGQQKHLIEVQAEQVQKSSLDVAIDKSLSEAKVKNVYNPKQRCFSSETTSVSAEENCELANEWSPGHYSSSYDSPNFYWETLASPENSAEFSAFELHVSLEAESDNSLAVDNYIDVEDFEWNQFTIGQALGSYFVN